MDHARVPVTVAYAALKSRCPRCGRGKLYRGLLKVREACGECGLELLPLEQGDGPASLSILLVGGLAGIGASVLDVRYQPSLWVHAAIWLPFVTVGSIVSLRWVKAALIAVQYRYVKTAD